MFSVIHKFLTRLFGKPKVGVLAGTRVYLSGPIENGNGPDWRIEPKRVLTERFKINVFDPFKDPKQQWVPDLNKARATKDYETMVNIAKSFVRKDLAIVDRSDFVISYMPHKVPTTGTHHEVINSNNSKKPTLIVCPQGKEFVPLWYFGFIPHECMFGSWDELYKYLEDVENGLQKENNRWHFVYGMI